MTDQMKNILIGLFVTAALTIMIAMILFLEPTIGDGKKIVHARFDNIAGITIGTRVTFAGKPVGEVVKIKEMHDARAQAALKGGRVYLYDLTLQLDSSVEVYTTDDIAIKTTGLMGERSVAILPRVPMPGKTAELVTDQILFANSIDPLENAFTQVTRVSNRMEQAIAHFDDWFAINQKPLTDAVASFGGAMGGVQTVLGTVDAEHLVPAIRESVDLLSKNLEFIRTSLDDDQLLHKIGSLANNLDRAAESFNGDGVQTLRNLNQISKDIASGSGTVGRMIAGDDFYLRLTSLLTKGETLMNDINHYGFLFQYDKSWQRSRTKKANFLKALNTPQEFRTYFEGEIDTMTTSLGRLTELIGRAEDSDARNQILQSDAFKRDFAVLMRQVQGLSDSIKLYNEGLIAQSEALSEGN
jgi:phospholipid/cholesterol/gamma-HCH transport system substrate-binding protein